MITDLDVSFHGVELQLCPERAAFRVDRQELLVADVHLGKAAAFRRAGKPLPKGTTKTELARLDAAVERKQAKRLTILGDLFHAAVDVDSPTAETFRTWLRHRANDLDITLVRGNHDRHAATLLESLPLRAAPEPLTQAPVDYRHHPGGTAPYIAGHIHPGLRIEDGSDALRVPIFWIRPDGLVLPAFGSFTGLQIIDPGPKDRMAAATPTGVVPLPPSPRSQRPTARN